MHDKDSSWKRKDWRDSNINTMYYTKPRLAPTRLSTPKVTTADQYYDRNLYALRWLKQTKPGRTNEFSKYFDTALASDQHEVSHSFSAGALTTCNVHTCLIFQKYREEAKNLVVSVAHYSANPSIYRFLRIHGTNVLVTRARSTRTYDVGNFGSRLQLCST